MCNLLFIDLGSAWGGQEIYSQNLIHNFVDDGYNITHVSSQLKHKRDDITFVKVKHNWSNFYANSVLISELIQNHQIVIFNGNRAIQQAFFIRHTISFVGIKHGPFSVSNFGILGNFFLKLLYFILFKKLDKIICVAKVTYDESLKLAPKKVKFLPNGVYSSKVIGSNVFTKNTQLNLIYCGRLIEDKGVFVILNAVLLVHNDKPFSVKLQIFGSGPLEPDIISFIKLNKLDDVIKFNGYVDDRDIIYNINKPSIMVFASKFEGMPLSILEAYSYGIPIVAYNAPGISDVVIDGLNGFLIQDKSFNPLSMKDKLLYLYKNEGLLDIFSNNNLGEFNSKYSFDKMFFKFKSELAI